MKILGNYILHREDEQSYILMPERHSKDGEKALCSLNGTGAFVWKQLEARRELDEIAALAAEKYTVEKDDAKRDILSFLEFLADQGLIAM